MTKRGEDRGSRIEDRRSRIEDRGSKIEDRRSRIEDRGSKIEDHLTHDGAIFNLRSSIFDPRSPSCSSSLHGFIFVETYNARCAAPVSLFRMLYWKPNSDPISTAMAIEIPWRGNFSEGGKTSDFARILRGFLGCASAPSNHKNVVTDNIGDKSVGLLSESLPRDFH